MADAFDDIKQLGEYQSQQSGRNSEVLTEDLAAREFASRHAGVLLYCHGHGTWFVWAGSHWRQERTGLAFDLARQIARELSDTEAPKVQAVARRTSFASGMERFAQRDRLFAVEASEWDRDPLLLGTPEGTVDLRTGDLRLPDPKDRLTKQTSVSPADAANCSRWLAFLRETTEDDEELMRFLQQWCGYALTGITREHALVFVYGPGGNGKSVFLNTLLAILQDYAVQSAMTTFTASRQQQHPADLAMLRGARLVTASETEEGHAWAESRIKQLTGGDRVTARFMHQNFFTFVPEFKLTIVGNHKPILSNVDDAARRRFLIVPFERKPAQPDRELEAKLMEEAPGILRWMIDGCLDWQQNGLVRPAIVLAATNEYFSDQDVFSQWLKEECDCEPGNPYKEGGATALYKAWKEYALRVGEDPRSQKSFKPQMQKRGLRSKHTKDGNVFSGVRLRPRASFHDGEG